MSRSRTELLAWVNELLQTNYSKIEQLGSGAAYCQIIDSIYGDVPLKRVKFNPTQEYEYLNNLKILQSSFVAHSIDRRLEVARLAKLKFQENYELLQWLRNFWEAENPGQEYDAPARRRGQVINTLGNSSPRPGSSASSAKNSIHSTSRYVPGSSRPVARTTNPKTSTPAARKVVSNNAATAPRNAPSPSVQSAALTEANNQIVELRGLLSTSEEERGYYYSKLRSVEAILQQHEQSPSDDIRDFTTEFDQEPDDKLSYSEIHNGLSGMAINEEETF
ncbi:hypothetical protein BB560_007202 [Smittium megazygosporum]|uniref:Calponin-homology (CH) domain-containing protein n=1 Tax=Smittium megazygosporum TaxID=133381 RepID=A0A2T9XY26_9FUNG|nr:hypothetical protein BB560_007202 [Smittium megazygosporum]